jgi:hypothetical protein
MIRFFLAALLFVLASGARAECVGQFTPVLGSVSGNGLFSEVMFFAKNGNRIIINGTAETIPPGVGVVSGGVVAAYNNAYINKAGAQTLAPGTTYFVYAFMSPGGMALDFSRTGHQEDPSSGQETMARDPTQTLVGMARTNAEGKFIGSASSQLTLSWCNRVRLIVVAPLNGLSNSSPTLAVPSGAPKIEWLQWGINNTFKQSANAPNLRIRGNIGNTVGNHNSCQAQVFLDGKAAGYEGSVTIPRSGDTEFIYADVPGANGTDEGYHYAQPGMSASNGGTCGFGVGELIAEPLDS